MPAGGRGGFKGEGWRGGLRRPLPHASFLVLAPAGEKRGWVVALIRTESVFLVCAFGYP